MSETLVRRSLPQTANRFWWIVPVSLLFIAQLILLTAFRHSSHELVVENWLDVGFMLVAVVVGYQAARRCHGLSRYVWLTAVGCCALFALSLVLGLYALVHPNGIAQTLSDEISVFWLAPLSFTLFLEPDFKPSRFDPLHIFDFLQIVVFWVAIYFFFLFLPIHVPQEAMLHPWLQATWAGSLIYDVSMALLFFLRSALTPSRSTRKLFGRLSAYLAVACVADFYANFYRLPSGTWYQVVWALLNITPIVLAGTWDDIEDRQPALDTDPTRLADDHLFPVITAFLVLICSMVIVRERLVFAISMVSISFVCSSWRLVVVQRRASRIAVDLQAEIAERTRAEQLLRENEEHLEEQVASRTSELRAANQQLRAEITQRQRLEEELRQTQKMEAIGTLSGGIAHDFNNLLTIIRGYARMVLDRVQGDPELKADVEQIDEAGARAATLTSQLLTFSRRQMLQPTVISLNSLVRDLERMLHRLIGEHIELLTKIPADLGAIKADPGQIEQVIMNLVVNARDAMPRGGKLIIETANVTLDEAYAREHVDVAPGAYVVLAVHDTGTGMDDAVKAHIFEPFFTTKGRTRGTGLGLSTVYGIVKQSGGSIRVESCLGKGTTFEIYLPRVQSKKQQAGPSSDPALRKGSETVLLVEDDEQVRSLTQHILERCGYNVHAAENAEAARDFFEHYPGNIDLLVTDVVMPGLSGPELADAFVQHRPRSRVLFISGYTDDAIGTHGILEEGIHLLQKPFTPTTLGSKVREILDRASVPRAAHA